MRQDARKAKGAWAPRKDWWFGRLREGWFARIHGWVGRGWGRRSDTETRWIIPGKSSGATDDCFEQDGTRPTWKEAEGSMAADYKQQLRVHIRWMIRRDMPEVLGIERSSFEFPWSEDDFIRCLRQRNCIGMVAEHGDDVVGFMIYELHKSRLHILNFAVADTMRQREVGSQMVYKLISKLSSQRRRRITLEVRETNLSAQLFFKTCGFRATAVLRSYYEDSPEDAYVMQYHFVPELAAALPIERMKRLAG
jgi:[ribosomal protein S18]-alanine N-acetyltransferase